MRSVSRARAAAQSDAGFAVAVVAGVDVVSRRSELVRATSFGGVRHPVNAIDAAGVLFSRGGGGGCGSNARNDAFQAPSPPPPTPPPPPASLVFFFSFFSFGASGVLGRGVVVPAVPVPAVPVPTAAAAAARGAGTASSALGRGGTLVGRTSNARNFHHIPPSAYASLFLTYASPRSRASSNDARDRRISGCSRANATRTHAHSNSG